MIRGTGIVILCMVAISRSLVFDPEQAPFFCSQPRYDGMYVAHQNCHQFNVCRGGIPVPHTCPPNTLYHANSQMCVTANRVTCGRNVDIRLAPTFCENLDFMYDWPHENCNQFYRCIRNVLTEERCEPNKLYGYTHHWTCHEPSLVDCGERVIEPFLAPDICATASSDGIIIAHKNCNQYYVCRGGVPLEFPCQMGQMYNAQTKSCDWPERVNCGNRTVWSNSSGQNYTLGSVDNK